MHATITCIGRLTADVECKKGGDVSYAKFTLVTDSRYKKEDGTCLMFKNFAQVLGTSAP
jgi:single-stranded DNA-binding protein